MSNTLSISPFNSPLETGIRSLAILNVAFPVAFDLQRLVEMDYLIVHSADAGGPVSLHAPLPLRAGELLVRRGLIERGLNLMISRNLVHRISSEEGFVYAAGETAAPFIMSLTTKYSRCLIERAEWVVNYFENVSTEDIRHITNRLFEKWSSQFESMKTARG